jgi:hypothetical protein
MAYAFLIIAIGQETGTSRELARYVGLLSCSQDKPNLSREWRNAPLGVNDRDIILSYRKMGEAYRLPTYTQHECIGGIFSRAPRHAVCFSIDPAAPSDIEDGKDLRRENFSNPRALRARNAYELIRRQ